MQVRRHRRRREPRVDRSLVVRVVIARNHHHRHPRTAYCPQRERKTRLADSGRIEQIADDQQQIGGALVGQIYHPRERATDAVAQFLAARSRAEGVGLEMDVRGVEHPERAIGAIVHEGDE